MQMSRGAKTACRHRGPRGQRAGTAIIRAAERVNGIALPQTGGVPVVSASLVLRSGSDANPLDKPGLAGFTADVLDKGTTTRNAIQLAEEVAQIGAALSTGTSRDATTISASLSRNFPAALALVADVALRPSFPGKRSSAFGRRRLPISLQQRATRCRSSVSSRARPCTVRMVWIAELERLSRTATDAGGSPCILEAALRSRQRRACRHRRDYGARVEEAG